MISEMKIEVYRKGLARPISVFSIEAKHDPSGTQSLREYNAEDTVVDISAAIGLDKGIISDVTVQGAFTDEEVWEVLFAGGEREKYFIYYEENP